MSFLKFTFRHFSKNKIQLSIALIGLVLGWSCFISISIYVQKELTFDHFNEKSDRIFRVTHNEKFAEIPGPRHLATVGPPVGPGLKETFPLVENFVRLRYSPDWIVRFEDHQNYENSVWYADPSFFEIFNFTLSEGNPLHALDLPNSVVITQEMAIKYFGQDKALGKTLTMNQTEWIVTGVLNPIPSNSHITFDFLLPFQSFRVPHGYPVTLESWGWISFHTYILLKDKQDAVGLQNQLPELIKQHWEGERAKKFKLELQPLKEIYLGEVKHDQIASGNLIYLTVLGIAGFMIMMVASFNFTNLFTAIGISRAKEVGVRKLIGATKGNLVWNLGREAIALVVISLFASLVILPLWINLLPWPTPLAQFASGDWLIGILMLLVLSLIIGSLSGFYPARLLIQYDFQKLLKGSFKVGKTGMVLRNGMLLVQFIVSTTLLCSVIIILSQMEYLRTKDLGYVKDELLLLHLPGDEVATKFQPLKNKLLQKPIFSNVSIGGGRMDGDNGNVPIYAENTPETGQPMSIDAVTFDFFKTIGISPVAGREFTLTQPADTLKGVIINVSAAKELGWTPETALGKKIRIGDIVRDGEVIGVVPDFNFGSLHNSIEPLIISYPRTHLQDVYVRFNSKDLSKIITAVSEVWYSVVPNLPLDYSFMNNHLESLYSKDQDFSHIFQFFAIVAICIACLGLYGLISQDVLYRVKEIGIRKVLGADTFGITGLLLKQFIILMAVANLIAWPLGYYFMNQWLNEFSYRIAISWLVFPVASMGVFLLCLLSVSFLSVKAAMANPAKSLRTE